LNTDANGVIIEEFLELNSMVCVNDGRGTRYDCCRNTESSLDLTFVSSGMAGITSWEVLSDSPMGSDHFPIIVTIGTDVTKEDEIRVPRWKLNKANWELFQVLTDRQCEELRCLNDVKLLNSELVSAIHQAAEISIPKASGRILKKSVPWWNEQCSAAIKERSKAFEQIRKSHTFEALVQYKRAQAAVRRTIRAAKRSCWREYCNTIGRETKLSDVWGVIRKMNGVKRNYSMPVLVCNGQTAVSNKEKAELLVETLVKVHSSENLLDTAKCYREETLAETPEVNVQKKVSNRGIDMPFSLFELKKTICNGKQSTPGKDGICYSMLGHLSERSLNVVLKLFNLVWETERIPCVWKQAVIVPVKPGKSATDPFNYRPINRAYITRKNNGENSNR